MSEQKTDTFWRRNNPIMWGVIATVAVFLFGVWAAGLPVCEVNLPGYTDCGSSKWAYFLNAQPNEVGDTLAGFAGALAFVWIIATVWLQGQELSEQRKVLTDQKEEFKKTNENMIAQRFEVSFFELVSTLNSIVESFDLVDNNGRTTARGRDCMRIFYERLERKVEKRSVFEKANTEFWEQYGHEFGHYFRFLYNAFRILSESEEAEERHGKLLRAMLSDYELLLLFYNALTPNGVGFQKYIIEFELFDNLPKDRLLSPEHEKLFDARAFGEKEPRGGGSQ